MSRTRQTWPRTRPAFDHLGTFLANQRKRIAQRLHVAEKRLERLRRTGRARKTWATNTYDC